MVLPRGALRSQYIHLEKWVCGTSGAKYGKKKKLVLKNPAVYSENRLKELGNDTAREKQAFKTEHCVCAGAGELESPS